MPTGYTACVADGTVKDFRTFALMCARAFGACMAQRDDDMLEKPKHREMAKHYVDSLATAKAELDRVSALTPEQAHAEAVAEREKNLARVDELAKDSAQKRARYEAMHAQVSAWEPPTPDHRYLRDFMLQQISDSISADCTGDAWYEKYYRVHDPIPAPKVCLAEAIAKAAQDVAWHTKLYAEEAARCSSANSWIDALYASLPAEVAT